MKRSQAMAFFEKFSKKYNVEFILYAYSGRTAYCRHVRFTDCHFGDRCNWRKLNTRPMLTDKELLVIRATHPEYFI